MKLNVHGGHSLKCRGASSLLDEVNEDRRVKNRVIELLRSEGHTVYDCTDDAGANQNANLKAIVNKCNAHAVDLDVSIHLNAGGGTGTEVYVYNAGSKSKPYAERIAKNISNALGIGNRGVKVQSNLYVLRKTNSPSLLVECCFVDNAIDKVRWDVEKCAKAIVEGITGKAIGAQKPASPGTYEVTASSLVVRTGPGTGYRRKAKKELTSDAQKHANAFGSLLKGTRVTVKEVRDGWARIPSGWVSMQYLKKG